MSVTQFEKSCISPGAYVGIHASRWPDFANMYFNDRHSKTICWGQVQSLSADMIGSPPAPRQLKVLFYNDATEYELDLEDIVGFEVVEPAAYKSNPWSSRLALKHHLEAGPVDGKRQSKKTNFGDDFEVVEVAAPSSDDEQGAESIEKRKRGRPRKDASTLPARSAVKIKARTVGEAVKPKSSTKATDSATISLPVSQSSQIMIGSTLFYTAICQKQCRSCRWLGKHKCSDRITNSKFHGFFPRCRFHRFIRFS